MAPGVYPQYNPNRRVPSQTDVLQARFEEHAVKRFGTVVGLRPEKIDEYKRLHAAVWPGVLAMIAA